MGDRRSVWRYMVEEESAYVRETFFMSGKPLRLSQTSPSMASNTFQTSVAVEARVAGTIWRLATNVEYQNIATLFGLGRSTVGEIVIDTCEAINTHLMSRYIRVPHEDSLRDIVDGFRHQWGFPQAISATDGTHIPYCDHRKVPLIIITGRGTTRC